MTGKLATLGRISHFNVLRLGPSTPPQPNVGLARRAPATSRAGNLFGFDPAGGVADEFGGGAEIEFFFDVAAVGVDGFEAEMEMFGDGVTVFALAKELENFEFA